MQQIMLNFLPNYQGIAYYPFNDFHSLFAFQQPYFLVGFNNSVSPQFFPHLVQVGQEPQLSIYLKNGLQTSSPTIQDNPLNAYINKSQNVRDKSPNSKGVQSNKSSKRKQKALQELYQGLSHSAKQGKERFIRKNTESNIINQVFSFLWTPKKSRQFLVKILNDQPKLQAFYNLMKVIKFNCKSQINRFYLKSLTIKQQLEKIVNRLRQKGKRVDQINAFDISSWIKRLVFIYLRSVSRYSIMTSKKMNPNLWKMHFRKCDEIISFLFEES